MGNQRTKVKYVNSWDQSCDRCVCVCVCVCYNPFRWTTSSVHQVAEIIGNGQGINNKKGDTLHLYYLKLLISFLTI